MLLLGDWCSRVIFTDRRYERFVQGDPTQKLCVRLDSIVTSVCSGNDRGDHLVLPAGERKIG